MTSGVFSLGARRLVGLYNEVSRAGRFETYQGVIDLIDICESIKADLPPHRAIVNACLRDFFQAVANNFDELAVGSISWPQLDAVILEAVIYTARGDVINDAARVAGRVATVRMQWTGQ